MKNLKIMWLTRKNLEYVSSKLGTGWNGDFDGSIIEMTIDKAFLQWVRIGVDKEKEEVLYFNKQLFTDFLLSNPKYKELAQKAYSEWKNSDGNDEFEYYQDFLESIVDEYQKGTFVKYISVYDFILDLLLKQEDGK